MIQLKDEDEYWAWRAEVDAEERRLRFFAAVIAAAVLIYLTWR